LEIKPGRWGRVRRPGQAARVEKNPVFTVTEVTAMVRDALEEGIPPVSVEGEISNLRRPPSGHTYFTLKDQRSQLRCVLFRSYGLGLRFQPRDGEKVVATGTLTVYEARGEYQLRVERLRPAGQGDLALAFIQLRDRLQKEGLFDPDHKRPLPVYPEVVGLVTSAAGAAVEDMIRILRRRWPPVRIVLRPTRVQGEGSELEIARALDEMSEWGGADVVILGRGGGSLEDLWAFNEEAVARAVHRCATPVISAVGHEIDFTISDFVADERAATPSAAAEMAVPVAGAIREELAKARGRMNRAVFADLKDRRQVVRGLAKSRALGRPQDLMDQTQQRLDELLERMGRSLRGQMSLMRGRLGEDAARLGRSRPELTVGTLRSAMLELARRLDRSVALRLERVRENLGMLKRQMEALGPQEVLERGFCIALGPGGSLLRDPEEAPEGTPFSVVMARGRLKARSEGLEKDA
jgi:exodeoxyribonuclease VII large subunit